MKRDGPTQNRQRKRNGPRGRDRRRSGPVRLRRAQPVSIDRWCRRQSGDTVVASVRDVQESPRRCEVNLGAGVTFGVPRGQRRDRLYSGEGARCSVQAIARNTAALLVRKVDEILSGMKTKVARTNGFRRLDPEGRIGGQMTSTRVELELQNHIRAGEPLRRFQDVIVETGDVRYERKAVGGIG